MTLFEFIREIVNRLRDEEKNHYGFFWKKGGVQIQENSGFVPFEESDMSSPEIKQDGGLVFLSDSGTYRACFLLYLPAAAEIHTTAGLYLASDPLPGSQVRIEKDAGASSQTVCGQCIFRLHSAAALSLRLADPAQWSAPPEELSASLEVTRLTALPASAAEN